MSALDVLVGFGAFLTFGLSASAQSPSVEPTGATIRVVRHPPSAWVIENRERLLSDARPELRGFRACLSNVEGSAAIETSSLSMPEVDHTQPVWRAADLVAHRLARDGLLATLAQVLEIARAPDSRASADEYQRSKIDWLRRTGLPVDLLACFAVDPDSQPTSASVVEFVERKLESGASAQSLQDELVKVAFRFRASAPGFRVAAESGEQDIGLVRLQMTSGTYWSGEGDGGSLDLARQLLDALPDASFFASIEEKHLERFLETARAWPIGRADRFTLSAESLPVAQWAQDDGKPGWIEPGANRAREAVTLVPRYASRGEDGAIFVAGETFLMDGFAATGRRVVQSPLLFQGGNVIAVRRPSNGERVLLVGEAEVYRNTALGLTRDQVLQAFQVELGVDRCAVLPAVSFHIDCELCVRAVDQELVVFVNDTPAAARIVFESGLQALESHAHIDARAAHEARSSLAAGRASDAVETISCALLPHLKGPGRFSETFAREFSVAPWDSGVGNLETFLLALDLLQSETARPRAIDPNTAVYLESLRRRAADRASLMKSLADLGLRIVRVPSFSDGDRGINYVNGVHARGTYLMPAQGGFYSALDRAAQFVFEGTLGPGVKILPVRSSESQRRSGALHCSVSVYGA
jgi:hypothetical protein